MRPSLLFLFALVSLSWCQAGTTLTSTFNPNSANGLSGTIVVTQPGLFPTTVTIQSRLNFTAFNWAAVRMAFPMCMDIQHLAWHVHVTWTNGQPQSGFLDACSNASTNGHYDSKFACGPNSQYAPDPRCAGKTSQYNCTQASFAQNRSNCENGDLSGRNGPFIITGGLVNSKVADTYFPPLDRFNFPMPNFPSTQWNWILHLMCPAAKNPRLVCAVMKRTR